MRGHNALHDLRAKLSTKIVPWLRVQAIAERRGVKAGQLALAWVLAQGEDVVPIPGTKRRKYLDENAGAAEIHLTPGEVEELQAAIPRDEIVGDRYTAASMTTIDR